jgi:translation elongation factor EF-G
MERLDIPEDLDTIESGSTMKISIRSFDDSIDTAFQLSTLRGPLCNEPVQGLAYFVEKVEIDESKDGAETCEFGQLCTHLAHAYTNAFIILKYALASHK